MLLSKLITDFLEYLELERNASQLTIRNYDHYLKRFLEFSKDIVPKDIDLSLVKKYRLFLSRYTDPQTQKPLKRITQNYFMIALRAFLRYLTRINIPSLPYKQVELEEAERSHAKMLDNNQLESLLNAPDTAKKEGLRDKAILETLFVTGLRVSELASLNRDAANLADTQARITLERYLSSRKDTFRPLFIRFQGKIDPANQGEAMRLTPRSIERVVEKYVKALNLPIKATPHTLRYCFSAKLK